MSGSEETPARTSELTRAALLDAAIHLFGRDGFGGTSTRAIAQRAEANVASIAYHFGGKDGLRLACGAAIAERIAGATALVQGVEPASADRARQALEAALAALARFLLLEPAAADMVRFILTELSQESPVIDAIYDRVIGPRHAEICRLWQAATGMEAESAETRLTVFSIIGQALYFRIGQSLVGRRMNWPEYDAARVRQVTDVLVANLDAIIAARRKDVS